MLETAVVAFYGAALGLSLRPAARAVIFGAVSVAAIQSSAIFLSRSVFGREGYAGLALAIQTYAGQQPVDVVPNVAVAAFAAMLCALVAAGARKSDQRRRTKTPIF